MYNIYVNDVVRLCGGKVLYGDETIELSTFCTDTRKINDGDVYVGICGENFDGNDFYKDAVNKGAKCLILSKEPEEVVDATVILVDDTLKCLQELAKYKRSLYDIPVIAITGSVGKTSTKDIVYSVVSQKYNTHKTQGNYNNHLGVPLTILGLRNHEALVIEMGMNHFGELSLLTSIAKPTVAIITNVGTSHIGNLGSREGIRKAKLEILEGLVGNKVIINQDDDMLYGVLDELKAKYEVDTFSIEGNATYNAINLEEEAFSSKFNIDGNTDDVVVNVGGRAYIYNSLVAYAVGKYLNIDDNNIKKGIYDFKLSPHRLEKKITKKGVTLIDDTYNANYDSMSSSLNLLGKVTGRRKVAVIGDMFELGEYTNELHTNIGDVVVDNDIDILVTVGEYSKLIVERALELGMNNDNIYSFIKEEDSHEFLEEFLTNNDIVLIKASHGMHLVGIVDHLMEK